MQEKYNILQVDIYWHLLSSRYLYIMGKGMNTA